MAKLSMPAGLLLEAAFAGGICGDQLIEVLKKKDLRALKHIGKKETSWVNLFHYAEENWDSVVEAVQFGYTFKFITIRGLLNLLQTRFGFIEDQDFSAADSYIELNLQNEQLDFLQSRIPKQWQFLKQENKEWNYRAVLSQPQQIKS